MVLNRVASPQFPNSVYSVIFQRNQFTPASNGRINRTPTAECVIAAKLAMEGTNTAGNALYFINPSIPPAAGSAATALMLLPSAPTRSSHNELCRRADSAAAFFMFLKKMKKRD